MPRIDDPALLQMLETPQTSINKNLNISDGQQGVGSQEAKTREAQFIAGPQRRALARDLAQAAFLNNRIPTGRFAARVNAGVQEFPPGWQNGNISDYQTMLGLRQAMTRPIVTMTSVAPSSKEMDAVKEQELAQSMIPGPEKEQGANINLINRAGRAVLDQEAFNAFASRWRANHQSVYDKAKNGQTMQQAWADYVKSPQYRRTVLTPFTKLIQPRPKASGGWKVERED